MDEPSNQTPCDPPATHWNQPRDPVKSFLCPLCGYRIRFVTNPDLDNGQPVALCESCRRILVADDWRYYKEMEILHGI